MQISNYDGDVRGGERGGGQVGTDDDSDSQGCRQGGQGGGPERTKETLLCLFCPLMANVKTASVFHLCVM